VLVNLATAVQAVDKAGLAVDVPLGDVQFALRNGKRIPIHGGNFFDGTTNVVGRGGRASASIMDEDIPEVPSGLDDTDGDPGYGVDNGTSFLLALAFTKDGPQAKTFLTYGNTEDRKDPLFTEATERFSRKEWRDIPLTEDAIQKATTSTITVKG
jgi:acyl-homoserine-lactone acylase